ncbi:hypothetical protein HZS_5896 [Henneguya salminicola]|nr:hypothetical protein HZS_5896 [Henneguya salminicola]
MLDDDSQKVRIVVIPYLSEFARNIFIDHKLSKYITKEKIFLSLCSCAISDPSYKVRIVALKNISLFTFPDDKTLNKTIKRTLYASSGNKKSYHESQRERFSGVINQDINLDFSLIPEVVQYIRRCPNGVYIDCLESEYWEVRSASIKSLYKLCSKHIEFEEFRQSAIDLLIDCLTDHQEKVRSVAIVKLTNLFEKIKGLTRVSSQNSKDPAPTNCYFEISDYQLDAIIGALSDGSHKLRKGLHSILSISNVVSPISLYTTIVFLIRNMLKFPSDTDSTYNCLKYLSYHNSFFISSIAFNLFDIHPFMETPETLLTEPSHIAILIIAYNSALQIPSLLTIFPTFFISHLEFLKKSFPQYILLEHDSSISCLDTDHISTISSNTTDILKSIFTTPEFELFKFRSLQHVTKALNYIERFISTHNKILSYFAIGARSFIHVCEYAIKINHMISPCLSLKSLDRPKFEHLCIQSINLCNQSICISELSQENSDILSILYLVFANLDNFLTAFPTAINLSKYLFSLNPHDSELKISVPDFDQIIKFHCSRLLKIKVCINLINIQNLAGIFLKIQFTDGQTKFHDVSNKIIKQDFCGLSSEFNIFISFKPWNDFGIVKITIVKFPLKIYIAQCIEDYFKESNHLIKTHADISEAVEIRCHPYC